ncbi:uncharacterized protein LOC120420705 [Culex pipiens pallens]|uniref:uncharacterized protein LOC120420705 n=1 Tax=Culex pipiens pallens TaxID=42434 RepID=UPI001952A86D|nr:uncharacterized protein LOC120414957 isoform X2 [Culex pipiens pallens]XP_039439736.1 uncharacterized protein LOC120420705 [Culex pipiens pallens]
MTSRGTAPPTVAPNPDSASASVSAEVRLKTNSRLGRTFTRRSCGTATVLPPAAEPASITEFKRLVFMVTQICASNLCLGRRRGRHKPTAAGKSTAAHFHLARVPHQSIMQNRLLCIKLQDQRMMLFEQVVEPAAANVVSLSSPFAPTSSAVCRC